MKHAVLALALAAIAPATPGMCEAIEGSSLHAGTLEVPLNKSQVVSADRPIARALLGSAEIADVLPITDRSVYVLGKKMGTTSLTLYDSAGRVLSILDIAVGPDVIALNDQLRQLVPGEPIEAHILNDSVVLTGTVNTAGSADRAMQLAKAYAGDKVINLVSMGSSQQIMLEVKFAEVNRSSGKDLGIDFFGQSRGGSFNFVTGKGASLTPDSNGNSVLKLSSITDSFGIASKAFSIGNTDIIGTINALETRGLAKVLAQPTLIALSGERASFLAGGEFPVPVAQSAGAGTGNGTAITVEFKPFGVSLGFTPTVLGDRTISMIVEPEVSAIDPAASLTLNGITIPGLKTRRASTTLELRDGESFAIAGLLQRDFQTTVNQLPVLGSIPILGTLFRSSHFQKGETELLIVVTPHLVAPIRPGQVRLPTDRVLDPREADTLLLGQSYRPTTVAPAVPPAPVQPQSSAQPAPVPSAQPPAQSQAVTGQTPTKGDGYAY
ncbi:type II and III secretion system protein family protein [Novosphingobium sp. G106]|uniref:type II and III secretion system protein family protein n=1 Tax=Novosphingobium sp. G106 TaxID=2849500 RepID=UPI001C2D7FF9|nr:type II and III secretion system protein family protein [Novosphingobium sp. G106]MBV1689328.1 type II and III secretion system protein family protein [Novosphingobium sp. G106]